MSRRPKEKQEKLVQFGPWPRRLPRGKSRNMAPEELTAASLLESDSVIAINKPGDFACHPAKDGVWSSLSSAVREHFALEAAHLVFRLDRETSGVVIYARTKDSARVLQVAAQEGRYDKSYVAVLVGERDAPFTVDAPLLDHGESDVHVQTLVSPEGKPAVTHFTPIACGGGFTVARVTTDTGRKHQIRAHASHAGCPLVGDKIYGAPAGTFQKFLEEGWTAELAALLHLERHALHCDMVDLRPAGVDVRVTAPLAQDMVAFIRERVGHEWSEVNGGG